MASLLVAGNRDIHAPNRDQDRAAAMWAAAGLASTRWTEDLAAHAEERLERLPSHPLCEDAGSDLAFWWLFDVQLRAVLDGL
jgi:hypothetical protein